MSIRYSTPDLQAAVDRVKADLIAEGTEVPLAADVATRLPQHLVRQFWDAIIDAYLTSMEAADGIKPQPGHFHTDEPLIQCGWLGQTGRYYDLGTDVDEPGGFSPVYRHWGEECGHQIAAEEGR